MQKQIAGLQGGPQPMSGPNPAMGANLAQWAAQRGPKNPNAPQPNISNMPGVGQTMPAGWQKMQGGGGQPPPGGAPGMMPDLMGQQNLAAKNLRPQGAPGQGPGGGKPQAMKQQMATLPGGPR
jgi:hypothetical protein